jgi:hypothetical protein
MGLIQNSLDEIQGSYNIRGRLEEDQLAELERYTKSHTRKTAKHAKLLLAEIESDPGDDKDGILSRIEEIREAGNIHGTRLTENDEFFLCRNLYNEDIEIKEEAREVLVYRCVPMLDVYAAKAVRKSSGFTHFGPDDAFDEAKSAAFLIVAECLGKYDISKGARFSTFVVSQALEKQISRKVRAVGDNTEHTNRKFAAIDKILRNFEDKPYLRRKSNDGWVFKEPVTEEEWAAFGLDVGYNKVSHFKEIYELYLLQKKTPVSIDEGVLLDDGSMFFPAINKGENTRSLSSEEEYMATMYTKDVGFILEELKKFCTAFQRDILEEIDQNTFTQAKNIVAKKHNVDRRTVQREFDNLKILVLEILSKNKLNSETSEYLLRRYKIEEAARKKRR